MAGNNNIGRGFQKHWRGTTSFPGRERQGMDWFLGLLLARGYFWHRRYIHSTLMGEALWPVLPGLVSSGECWSWGSRVSANAELLSVSRCQQKE